MIGRVALVLVATLAVAPQPGFAQAAPAPAPTGALTTERIKTFLRTAKIVASKGTDKGVTAPRRLTLTDGDITHDAIFQAIDEHKLQQKLGLTGATELNFVDSYKYNIAAYELATLLGLENMMPVYVERSWNGQTGSLSWFLPSLMDESERLKRKVSPPDPAKWNQEMYRMRVFSALTRDTDRNLTNVLISPKWDVVMIDFSRAFRLQPEIKYASDLPKIDRALFARLQAITREDVERVTKDWLTTREIDPLMQRRDLLVAHFKKLIAERGDNQVLY